MKREARYPRGDGLFFNPNAGIRTRQGAELRKREAFSSAARKERSDAAKAGGASRTRISRWGHHLKREARYPRELPPISWT